MDTLILWKDAYELYFKKTEEKLKQKSYEFSNSHFNFQPDDYCSFPYCKI